MLQSIRDRIEQRLEQATLEHSPFPHLIIEEFFPEDVFAKILEYNPFLNNAGADWMAREKSQNVTARTPYHARKHINFHMDQPFDAPPEQRAFWDELTGCFLKDDWFPSIVLNKFPEFFRLRFGDLVDDADFLTHFRRELFVQRHEPGYYIGPHTDIATRIFTCIFSFADRPGFEEFGTELLVPKDRMDRCWGSDHYGPERFEVRKIAPYKPNNLLLFFKTRHSFHSVRAIDDTVPNQRYGMQFQLYEPMGGLFNDLSTPDLMTTKRPGGAKPSLAKKIARKLALT